MRLASFDIFDTTLLRRCGRPEAVWNALAENLFPEEMDLQEAFVVWRKNAQGETLEEKYDGIDPSFLYFDGSPSSSLSSPTVSAIASAPWAASSSRLP